MESNHLARSDLGIFDTIKASFPPDEIKEMLLKLSEDRQTSRSRSKATRSTMDRVHKLWLRVTTFSDGMDVSVRVERPRGGFDDSDRALSKSTLEQRNADDRPLDPGNRDIVLFATTSLLDSAYYPEPQHKEGGAGQRDDGVVNQEGSGATVGDADILLNSIKRRPSSRRRSKRPNRC